MKRSPESIINVADLPFYPKHVGESSTVREWCEDIMVSVCKEYFLEQPENETFSVSLQSKTYFFPQKSTNRSTFDEQAKWWNEGLLKISYDPKSRIFSGRIFLSDEEECLSFGRLEMVFVREELAAKKSRERPCF